MQTPRLAFIGAGNMARAIIHGLLEGGYPANRIRAADPDPAQREALSRRCPVATHAGNAEALEGAEVVILAVKPQILAGVLAELAPKLAAQRPLIISIAAGVRSRSFNTWLGYDAALVRAMPNTPALVGSGASALHATPVTSNAQRELAESILRAVGLTLWLDDEDLMDAVTAVSGSGPAYFFLFMEAMVQVGQELGLSAEQASLLTLQTAFGAAKLALESEEDAATLRHRVTSPGGTTERAIAQFLEGDLPGLVRRALTAARDRSRELAGS